MKITYHFRMRIGKQVSSLIVKFEGYGGTNYTISYGKIIKFPHVNKDAVKIDEKHSSKRWPKYMNCTINEDGLQVEYKDRIRDIEVRTFTHQGFIDVISFEAHK